jgi:DNA-binding CsgD family transcriptional regulator/tetratricopeptide (TPR) repeat protein
MNLLEREPILAQLDELLRDAVAGIGRVAAISGEAGVGKTSLVDHFVAKHADRVRALHGMCDPLSTPRPLGPVHDMANQSSGPLANALFESAGRERLFSAFLAELGRAPIPHVVIMEDVHWADDATLDLLKFLGRRIRRLPTLLLITYRDDEVGPDHQLHHLLGAVPQNAIRLLHLPLLSETAVRELARQSGRDESGLYALTGGNSFFVTEVLASSGGTVPASIREAVLARGTQLSAPARAQLDIVSVVPGRVERRLLESLFDDAAGLARECAAAGMLTVSAESVGFRHELARLAWLGTLEPGSVARLHARVLSALLEMREAERNLGRIVHHADNAGDRERVLHFAPEAAREAAAVGAHRQAVAHYSTALRHADALPPAGRASLLESIAYVRYVLGEIPDAVNATHEALALRRSVGDRLSEGVDLRWLSRLTWMEGLHDDAMAFGEQAIAILQPLGPTSALAGAYSNLAQLHMLLGDVEGATSWGERAIALAEQLGDMENLVHALGNVGTAKMFTARLEEGRQMLARSIELALQHGYHEQAARGYVNIACSDLQLHEYTRAIDSFERVISFAIEHEVARVELYGTGWRARLHLELGNWDAAERDATFVIGGHQSINVMRFQPLIVLALLRARRGEGGAEALIAEALAFALPTREMQRIAPAMCARAETAWLLGKLPTIRDELLAALEITRHSADEWGRAQLLWWQWRAGDLTTTPGDAAEPHRLQFQNDWCGSADAWARIGAPYERALALAQGDTQEAWREALDVLEKLGAHAAAAAVRRDLRQRGVRGIPRGPRASSRRHPAGLTAGQVRVLELLVQGLSNSDIAQTLFLSPRTVDHHVSAILSKLDVTTRAAAIAASHDRQLLR